MCQKNVRVKKEIPVKYRKSSYREFTVIILNEKYGSTYFILKIQPTGGINVMSIAGERFVNAPIFLAEGPCTFQVCKHRFKVLGVVPLRIVAVDPSLEPFFHLGNLCLNATCVCHRWWNRRERDRILLVILL